MPQPKYAHIVVSEEEPSSGEIGTNELWFRPSDSTWHKCTSNKPVTFSTITSGSSGGAAWGDITGTLSAQNDLTSALGSKAGLSHTHDGYATSVHDHTGTYETANTNIQTHVGSSHAPANAQKNSDITKSEIEAVLTGEISSHSHAGGSGGLGYAIRLVSASQSTTTDGQTLYWGGMAVAPSTTAARWRTYIPKAGTIKVAYIFSYAGTAGTNENWSMNIRLNNTSDTLIQTLAANTNARVWSHTNLNISVNAGDYIEIKEVQPTWATNPATVTRNGVIYIE
jgi:hypothetical protein